MSFRRYSGMPSRSPRSFESPGLDSSFNRSTSPASRSFDFQPSFDQPLRSEQFGLRRPFNTHSFDIPVQHELDTPPFSSGTFPRLGRRESDLEKRQRQWDDEVEKFRMDFFKDTPFRDNLLDDPSFSLFNRGAERCATEGVTDMEASAIPPPESFAVEFDMKGYGAKDITVRTIGEELTVKGLREVVDGGAKFVNEFNKSVQLPRHVDPSKLVSSFSEDGLLTVQMPPPPSYQESVQGDTDCSMSEVSEQSDINSV